jgi:hypothetical protein
MTTNHRSLLQSLARELGLLLDPVSIAVESPEAMEQLLAELGVFTVEAGPAAAFSAVLDLKTQIETLAAQDELNFEAAKAALNASRSAFALTNAISDVNGVAGEMAGLGRDLVDLLIEIWLVVHHPVAREVCALLTLLEAEPDRPDRLPVVNGDIALRTPIRLDRLRLDRLTPLLHEPVAMLKAKYVNELATDADAASMANRLFPQLVQLLRALGVSCRYGFQPGDETQLGDAAKLMEHALIVYAIDPLLNGEDEAGVVLTLSPASSGDLGLVVSPFGVLNFLKRFERWEFESKLEGQVDVLAWGRHGLTLVAATEGVEVTADIVAKTVSSSGEEPAYVFGANDGTRIEFGSVRLAANMVASQARRSLALSADTSSSAIVIAPSDGDGFLSKILPTEGLRAEFDLGLAWSNEHGLRFRGTAGLDVDLPIGLSFKGVSVPSIHLGLQPGNTGLAAEVSANVSVSLGPMLAVIHRVGLETLITFPEEGGNLGVADLDFRLKPPSGVGLAIDAPSVRGGGFLAFDELKGEYSGILEIEIFEKISVKAMGVLTTKMPDGTGYSLVVLIYVEGFTPIPLGLGFVLTGIGGLFGLNRTFDEQALRSGLKEHALDSLMFPKDPVRNAPQIISNISKVFPPAKGHHLFGPMVQIAWGNPALITAEVALLLEFGGRFRLIVLAQIAAILPTRDNDLVRLQLDAFGVIDFDRGTASLDGTLYGSRLVKKFVLTGDMALRLSWESPRNFALAVGGLHPAYKPPQNFPKLERLAIELSAGDNPRLRCEAYFAITANTLQFGARAELYAAAFGFSINGEVGFDVLIQRDPFHFIADFSAHVQLKRGKTSICKVTVAGALSGPRPLHVKGKATFEVFWWDVSISFDKTLLEGERPPSALPINVLPLLKEALTNVDNWVGTLPDSRRQMATFRNVKPANQVLLHPLGTLSVKQTVVPLKTAISRIGSAPLQGANVFTIEGTSFGTTTDTVTDYFAPAQFFEMSDDAKLASPSFESLPAGVKFASSDGFSFPTADNAALETSGIIFETHKVTIDGDQTIVEPEAPASEPYQLPGKFFAQQFVFGAAGQSVLRRIEKYKGGPAKFEAAQEEWGLVDAGKSVPLTSSVQARGPFTSYSEARRFAREEERLDPVRSRKMKVVRFSELN